MDKDQPYPGADVQNHGFGNRGGFGLGAPPCSIPPPAPPWSVQHGHWPPFHSSVPPSTYPPPLHFDPSRPPPGYYGEQQAGPWPLAASRGQHAPITDSGPVPFTHYGAAQQPSFQPINPGLHLPADRHNPPSMFPSQLSTPRGFQNREKSADAQQRLQDAQWIKSFLQRRRVARTAADSRDPAALSVSQFRQKLYGAVQTLSELTRLCQTLKENLENERVWDESCVRAAALRSGLRETVAALSDNDVISGMRKKLELIKKKRLRMRRRKMERAEEKQQEEMRAAEREAAIDKFQMKQIHELEEKNRERELKLAADAVLSEVRKKQADSKRMTDILKALEKLRKLRKEAASRKGMFPEKECDEVFEGHLTRLRSLIKKRTAVYGAEEKALNVMLEGEQEEERKRDREKRLKKEREKLLLKKQEIETILFGAELPPDHPLQPFQEYYTQAERSLPALIQIRREWDHFLVPADHPDGTSIPQGWVLPDPPADDLWATALEK